MCEAPRRSDVMRISTQPRFDCVRGPNVRLDAREKISEKIGMYANLPSHRAMLDREGVAAPGDIALDSR